MTLAFNCISDYWVFYLVTMTSCPSTPSSKARCKVPRSPRRVSFDFVDSERGWRCNRWGPGDMLCESSHIGSQNISDQDLCRQLTKNFYRLSLSALLSIFMEIRQPLWGFSRFKIDSNLGLLFGHSQQSFIVGYRTE